MNPKVTLLILFVSIYFISNAQNNSPGVEVDTTITKFHFAAEFSGTFIYTKNGPSDITGTNPPSAFSVTVSKQVTLQEAKQQVVQLETLSVQNGYRINNRREADTLINGNKAYYIFYKETVAGENYENLIFNAIVQKGNTTIIFTSGDLDKGKYIELFKKTFYSLNY